MTGESWENDKGRGFWLIPLPWFSFQKDLLCFTYFLSFTCCYSSDAHIKLTVTTVLEFINRNKEYSTYKYTLIIV